MLRHYKIFCRYLFLIVTLTFLSGCAVLNLRAKADYTVEIANMDFIYIEGGSFQMGSTKRRDERPVHTVTIQNILVGMYEVTFAQYDQFCKETNRALPTDEGWGRADRPVINVSWQDAIEYSKWLSKQTGQQLRLPSESEWEYFARAGTSSEYWTGDTLPEGSANCSNCGNKWDNKMTAPVGSFSPNAWSVYDTAGNVVEWVLDDYKNGYKGAPTDGSAVSLAKETRKVQRGGAWNYRARELKSSSRDYNYITDKRNYNGFRLVMIPSAELQP